MEGDQLFMGQVISSHPAWQRDGNIRANHGKLVWPTNCNKKQIGVTGMADFTRELSQEYWRPATTPGNDFQKHGFQTQGTEPFCSVCGTQYAAGARFCHVCGLGREDDLHVQKRAPLMDWLDLSRIREQTGLSTLSLVLVIAAAVCLLATVMTGLVYNTATIAEWQAVQTWRVEWLLATIALLLAAMLFRTKS
jgi:hypothetical protein